MLGWWISIYKQVDYENPEKETHKKEYLLAMWETSVSGINWLEKLVKNGVAKKVAMVIRIVIK